MGPTVCSRGYLRPAGRFFPPLPLHLLRAGQPKLHTGPGVNGVVNAAVAGHKTPQHLAVCGVDNGIAAQGCNVPLPQVNSALNRLQAGNIRRSPALCLFLQVGVLHAQKRLAGRRGRAHVHQAAQQALLFGLRGRNFNVPVLFSLAQQIAKQKVKPLRLRGWLRHGATSFQWPLRGKFQSSFRSAGSAPAE